MGSVVQGNITEKFEKILEDEKLDAIKLFDVSELRPPDVKSCVERDENFVQILYERFKSCLDVYQFILAEAKCESKKGESSLHALFLTYLEPTLPFSSYWQFQKL